MIDEKSSFDVTNINTNRSNFSENYSRKSPSSPFDYTYSNQDAITGSNDDIFALANAFLNISAMTNKKLQKMCYYAKAWYLALYDENIIQESFEAWVHGAVNPRLYNKYKSYGFKEIPKLNSLQNIPEEFNSFAQEVYRAYGDLTGDELEQLNHQEDPWIRARGNLKPWEKCSAIITEMDMKEYYRKMIKK